jgi:hypothetical protein
LAKAIDKVVGLRSNEECEQLGLDLAYHGEDGYGLEPAPVPAEAAFAAVAEVPDREPELAVS